MLKSALLIGCAALQQLPKKKHIMFYPQELPHPRARRPLYGNYIDKTVPPHQKATGCCKDGKFVGLMLPYLKEYCAKSSVHGFRYLTDPKLRTFER